MFSGLELSLFSEPVALIGLRKERALMATNLLSGRERLKVALAVLLMGPNRIDLLLLDEPDNHLDLASQKLLADSLNAYRGTLIMITHSNALADAVFLSHCLELTAPIFSSQ